MGSEALKIYQVLSSPMLYRIASNFPAGRRIIQVVLEVPQGEKKMRLYYAGPRTFPGLYTDSLMCYILELCMCRKTVCVQQRVGQIAI